MRPEKRKSFDLRDQATYPKRSKVDHTVLQPLGSNVDTFASSSGKRETTSIYPNQATSGYYVPRTSNIEEISSQVGVNRQQNKYEVSLDAGASQIGAHRSLPALESCNAGILTATSGSELQRRSALASHARKNTLQQEFRCPSCSHLVTVENSNKGVQLKRSTDVSNNRSWSQKDSNYETAGTSEEERAAAPQIEEPKTTPVVDISANNGSGPSILVEDGQKLVQHSAPPEVDKSIKLSSGEPSVTVGDKLWDGRVRLTTSMIVSAVAFFKSGEKFPGTKWPDFIEVKGHINLKAFKVYVKDLHRSSKRDLMVISLCGKKGSSKTEFMVIKEFSNRYRNTENIGLAELSEGTTLYICPCSHTIIKILAKYHFLKGGVGVKDTQDSLIGCLVWRKSQFSSNTVPKTLESNCASSSEQPIVSAPGPLTHQVAGEKSYPAKPDQQISKSTASATAVSSSLGSFARNGDRIKKIESSDTQVKIINSSAAATVPPTSPVPRSISVAQVGQQMSIRLHRPYQTSSGPFVEAEASHSGISRVLHSKLRMEDENVANSVQLNRKKTIIPTFDEDDLPIFDFEVEGGISATALSKHDMEIQAQGSCTQAGSVSTTEVHTLSSDMLTKKSRVFDDDNDMPEWCPPEPYRHSLEEANRSSATFTPKLPKSSFKNISLVGPRPVILPPTPSSIHSQFTYLANCPAVQRPPRPMYMESSSSVSSGVDSTPALRSQSSSLDVRPPHQLPGRTDWWTAN